MAEAFEGPSASQPGYREPSTVSPARVTDDVPSESVLRVRLPLEGGRLRVTGRRFGDLEIGAVFDSVAAIVAVRGEVDALTAPTLTAVLSALAGERHGEMTLDLAGCTFMDAAGLRTITLTSNAVTASGGSLTVRDASIQILRILDLTGVDELVHIESRAGATLNLEPLSVHHLTSADRDGAELAGDLAQLTSTMALNVVVDSASGVLAALADATVGGADGASVTLLRDGTFVTVASTNETILRMDGHQYETGQGPRLDAATEGHWFQTDSLATEDRWPAFSPRALDEGIVSILSTPLMGTTGGPRGRPEHLLQTRHSLRRAATRTSWHLRRAGLGDPRHLRPGGRRRTTRISHRPVLGWPPDHRPSTRNDHGASTRHPRTRCNIASPGRTGQRDDGPRIRDRHDVLNRKRGTHRMRPGA